MTTPRADSVARNLRRIVAGDACRELSDRELLRRFASDRDEAAFGELLRRHGPMVLRVSRRLLRNEQDAEDVFQAAFLVLARQAGSSRWRESVANWLYGVARRLALKARAAAARREARAGRPTERRVSDPLAELTVREAQAILDEELTRLPERYRGPLVLCHLEGATRDEAARQLGWSLGTLRRRLEQGRGLLRGRLARRGLTLPEALAAVALGEGVAGGALPGPLATSIVRAAVLFAGDARAGTAGLPGRAAALAEEAVKAGPLAWLKTAVALWLALGVAFVTAGLPAPQAGAPGQPAAPRGGAAGPPAKAARVDSHGDPLPPGALLRLGSLRLRAGAPVFAVLPTPDGKGVFAGSWTSSVRLWEAATGKELRSFDVPQKPGAELPTLVNALALSRDGRTLAAGGRVGPLYLWEVATGKLLRTVAAGREEIGAVALSPDGKLLATTAGRPDLPGEIILWSTGAGRELCRLRGHQKGVYHLTFSPAGKLLASAGEDGTVRLWDAIAGKPANTWEAHGNKRVTTLAFAPDGKTIASAGVDEAFRLWEVATGKLRTRFPNPNAYGTLAFSPDGKLLATSSSGAPGFVALWELASRDQVALIPVDVGVGSLMFLSRRDGSTLAAGKDDGTVGLWDLPGSAALLRRDRSGHAAKALHVFGHQGAVYTTEVSPDGKTIATCSQDRTVRLWDAGTGKEIRQLRGHTERVVDLCYSRDGKLLASGGDDNRVNVWETATGKRLRQFEGRCVAFSPDGKLLAAATSDQGSDIKLVDLATGKVLRRLRGHKSMALRLVFSPNGKILASGGMGAVLLGPRGNEESRSFPISLWEVTSGKKLCQFGDPIEYVYDLVFAPDGRTLISGGEPRGKDSVAIRLWEVATGMERGRIPSHRDTVNALALSPDGRTLASGGKDGTARLWDLHTGKELRRLTGHRGSVQAVAFGPGGRTLVTGSWDSTALVWDVSGLAAGRDRAPRPGPSP
jgi:RNA polymerase sigma factor (sigma-70 family)